MPFKKKPTITVGRNDWAVEIPRPPNHATHAVLTCLNDLNDKGKPKVATVQIQDMGAFKGVRGTFHYIRMNNSRKLLETYKDTWEWDGRKVMGIEKL